MNERIEQLAEQCWIHTKVPLFGAKSPHWEFDRQKFAELIVRECLSNMEDCDGDLDFAIWKTKKDFEIEE